MADGVPTDKLYPLDIDRALRKLTEIKNNILWYDGLAQAEQYMTDGQAQLGLVADGRVLSAIGTRHLSPSRTTRVSSRGRRWSS
jgi:putative spermidine/putrescine transport system substrate-binding protein